MIRSWLLPVLACACSLMPQPLWAAVDAAAFLAERNFWLLTLLVGVLGILMLAAFTHQLGRHPRIEDETNASVELGVSSHKLVRFVRETVERLNEVAAQLRSTTRPRNNRPAGQSDDAGKGAVKSRAELPEATRRGIEYAEDGAPLQLLGTAQDVSELKAYQQQLHALAFYDTLTELPNRELFNDRPQQELIQADRCGRREIRMHSPLACLVLSLGLLASAHSEELTWDTTSLIGVAELKNGEPAEGLVYDLQRLMEHALPDLEHRYVISSPKRMIQNMASGALRCTTLLLRDTEHERVGYFVPFVQAPPMQLIVRSEIRGKLPIENGQINLSQLLRMDGLRGAVASHRGYPPDLQILLDQALAAGRIQKLHSNSSGSNLLSMISYGRLDYSFEFPIVLKRVTETTALPAPLEGIPIAENTQLSHAGFYCTRSTWGKDMAIHLDRAIRQIAADPETLLALYRKAVDAPSFDHDEQQLRTYLEQRANTATNF